jgi:hypothetical protein
MTLAEQAAADAGSDAAPSGAPSRLSIAQQAAADASVAHAPTQPFSQAASPVGSDFENFAAGAGKAVHDLGQGAAQLVRGGMSYVPGGSALADKAGLTTQADVDESKRLDAPLMATKAGTVGNIAGNVATTMIPLGGMAKLGVTGAGALLNPTTYKAAVAAGALSGLLQPVGTGDNRAGNVALGAVTGLGGNAAVNTVGRIAQPIANTLGPMASKAINTLQGAGIPLDAAQQTGSPFLNAMKSSFYDNPFTRGTQQAAAGNQQQAFNKAILSTIGHPEATAATSDVMGKASDRINSVFKDVLDRNHVAISDPTVSKISAIQQAANDDEKGPVSNMANRIISMVGSDGKIPGQQMYAVKKDLDRLASSPDSTLAFHARNLRSTVMDSINDSLPEQDRQAFQQARQQFGNLKKIEPAISKDGNGNISASTLSNVMGQKANRGASIYGNGDQTLVNLAQSGRQLLGDKMPNSGTAMRAAMQIAGPLALGGGAYAASDKDEGLPWGKVGAAAALGFAAPRAMQAAINSPGVARYVSQGMGGPLRNLLLSGQNNQLVGGGLRRLPGAAVQALQPAP